MSDLSPIPKTFSTAVAERKFAVHKDRTTIPVIFELGAPLQDVSTVEGSDWRCPVRIVLPDDTTIMNAHGVDSSPALQLSFRVVLAELQRLKSAGYAIFFLDEPFDTADSLAPSTPLSSGPTPPPRTP